MEVRDMGDCCLPPAGGEHHFLDVVQCSCCTRGFLEHYAYEPIHDTECSCRECVPGVELLPGLAVGLWVAAQCAKAGLQRTCRVCGDGMRCKSHCHLYCAGPERHTFDHGGLTCMECGAPRNNP